MPTPLSQITTLARSGALERAWGLFAQGGYLSASDDPAALAVKGRLYKDRALLEQGRDRAFLLNEAITAYAAADSIEPQPWLLLNVATLTLLGGDEAGAVALADQVLARIAPGHDVKETPYFLAATRAEALLIKGDIAGADAALAEARVADPDGWSDHATTLRQFRLILNHRGADKAWLDKHRPPRSMHFAGHLGIDPDDCAELRGQVEEVLTAQNVGFAYGALAAGADIVIAEAVLARGAELHVFLPAERDVFVSQSVTPFGDAWLPRFEVCLAAAASVTVTGQGRGAYEPLATDLAADRAMGAAALNARLLETSAVQLLVVDDGTDGPWGGGKHTGRDGERWRSANMKQHVLTAPRMGTVPPSSKRNEGRGDLALAALLHVRFDGIDHMGEGAFAEAVDSVIGPVRAKMLALPGQPVEDVPCGNARILRFGSLDAAAAFARALHALDPPDSAGRAPLTLVAHYGLLHTIGDMHAGPVLSGLSTLLPATMGGSLVFSAAFTQAWALSAGDEVRFVEIGDAGGQPLYGLSRMG